MSNLKERLEELSQSDLDKELLYWESLQAITALEAKCARLEAALENIQAESERENSRPVHLKRVVDINTRTALNESQDHE